MDNEVGTVCEPALGQHVRGADNDDVDTREGAKGHAEREVAGKGTRGLTRQERHPHTGC